MRSQAYEMSFLSLGRKPSPVAGAGHIEEPVEDEDALVGAKKSKGGKKDQASDKLHEKQPTSERDRRAAKLELAREAALAKAAEAKAAKAAAAAARVESSEDDEGADVESVHAASMDADSPVPAHSNPHAPHHEPAHVTPHSPAHSTPSDGALHSNPHVPHHEPTQSNPHAPAQSSPPNTADLIDFMIQQPEEGFEVTSFLNEQHPNDGDGIPHGSHAGEMEPVEHVDANGNAADADEMELVEHVADVTDGTGHGSANKKTSDTVGRKNVKEFAANRVAEKNPLTPEMKKEVYEAAGLGVDEPFDDSVLDAVFPDDIEQPFLRAAEALYGEDQMTKYDSQTGLYRVNNTFDATNAPTVDFTQIQDEKYKSIDNKYALFLKMMEQFGSPDYAKYAENLREFINHKGKIGKTKTHDFTTVFQKDLEKIHAKYRSVSSAISRRRTKLGISSKQLKEAAKAAEDAGAAEDAAEGQLPHEPSVVVYDD